MVQGRRTRRARAEGGAEAGKQQQWGQDRGAGESREGGGEMVRTQGYVPLPGYDIEGIMIAKARVMLQTSKMGKKTDTLKLHPRYLKIRTP